MSKISILLAEDHTLTREGFRQLISSNPDFKVVGEADNGLTAIKNYLELKPDILIIDILMPGISGIDAIKKIRKNHSSAKIIALTADDSINTMYNALKLDVNAYLKKSIDKDILNYTIKMVFKNRFILCPESSKILSRELLKRNNNNKKNNILTHREKEISELIIKGYRRINISEKLGISIRTVDRHKNSIYKKLNISSEKELCAQTDNTIIT